MPGCRDCAVPTPVESFEPESAKPLNKDKASIRRAADARGPRKRHGHLSPADRDEARAIDLLALYSEPAILVGRPCDTTVKAVSLDKKRSRDLKQKFELRRWWKRAQEDLKLTRTNSSGHAESSTSGTSEDVEEDLLSVSSNLSTDAPTEEDAGPMLVMGTAETEVGVMGA